MILWRVHIHILDIIISDSSWWMDGLGLGNDPLRSKARDTLFLPFPFVRPINKNRQSDVGIVIVVLVLVGRKQKHTHFFLYELLLLLLR